MPRAMFLGAILVSLCLLTVACSQSPTVAPTPTPDQQQLQQQQVRVGESASHVLWGYYQVVIDPVQKTVHVVHQRSVEGHYSAAHWITPPSCGDCLIWVPTGGYQNNILPLDVTIKNPLPKTGYDTRGILISDTPDIQLTNPDDYTRLYDNGGAVSKNPFRAFAKEAPDRGFVPGAVHTEHFDFYLSDASQTLVLDFAVDTSWPGRAAEPYEIGDVSVVGDVDNLGLETAAISVDVLAASNDVDEVSIDAPSMGFGSPISLTHQSGNTWGGNFQNTPHAAPGDYKCMVQASTASSDNFLYDYFTITVAEGTPPNGVTVASPNGAESWQVGSNHDISWSSTGSISFVKIEYSNDGGATYPVANLISSSTANDGLYTWNPIPNTPSTTAKVRISDASNAATNDASDSNFNIVTPPPPNTVTVTAPNGAESWLVGSNHDISWSSTGSIGFVKIEYSTDGGTTYPVANLISSSTANDGLFTWNPIPNTPSTVARVRISDASNAATNDASNANFSIVTPPSITVTAPNGAESWLVGSSHDISWLSTGSISFVKIEYSTDGGATYPVANLISSSTANDGLFTWNPIPNSPSTMARVRISDASNAATNDASNANFSIVTPPTVTVTAPNGAESWLVGSSHDISWLSTGSISFVKIEYSTDGGTTYPVANLISSSTANDGLFTWNPIPNTPSTMARVRISDASNAATNDASNANFSIVTPPTVTVTAPNGAESWLVGSSHDISWLSTGSISFVKIEYSTDGGATYPVANLISSSTANDGLYTWNPIPNSPTTTARVRISDASNAATNDASNANFSITAAPPAVKLSTDVQPILTDLCVGCHDNGGEFPNMQSGFTWASLVNKTSHGSSVNLITAGNPAMCYVTAKMRGIHAGAPFNGAGKRMPWFAPYISDAQLALIDAWITQGALNN